MLDPEGPGGPAVPFIPGAPGAPGAPAGPAGPVVPFTHVHPHDGCSSMVMCSPSDPTINAAAIASQLNPAFIVSRKFVLDCCADDILDILSPLIRDLGAEACGFLSRSST